MVTYSLANAPGLAYDLVRLPRGADAASVLRAALACGPADVAALAARHPGPHRAHRWGQVLVASSAWPSPPEVDLRTEGAGAHPADATTSTAVAHRPARAVLGDVAALEHLLRHEVLDWTWLSSGDLAVQDPEGSAACDVLSDAAASDYCSAVLDDRTRWSMSAPYLAARPPCVRSTGHEVVDAALEQLASTGLAGRGRWRQVVARSPAPAGWAPAMHDAMSALSLAGRVRLAADAQLAAAEAFRAAGFDVHDVARGVWNAVSGTLQAVLAADLLPSRETALLLSCWRRVHHDGSSPL